MILVKYIIKFKLFNLKNKKKYRIPMIK